MAHMAHEEECSVSVMGRDYIIDLGTLQQVMIMCIYMIEYRTALS